MEKGQKVLTLAIRLLELSIPVGSYWVWKKKVSS